MIFMGRDDFGVYCISRGEAGVTPYWTGLSNVIMSGRLSYPGPGPMSRSTVLFVLPGSNEPRRSTVLFVLAGPMSRLTVLFVLPGQMSWLPVLFVLLGPMSWSTVLFVLLVRLNWSMMSRPAGPVIRSMTIMGGMLSCPTWTGYDESVNSVSVTFSANTVSVATTGVAFQDKCDVPSDSG